MLKKVSWLLVLIMVFSIVLTGCGGGGSDTAPAPSKDQSKDTAEKEQPKEPVKIGTLYPMSGSMALLGEESFRGAELARLVRNEQGGLWGRPIDFVKADAPDANAAQAEADRLITKEGMELILGSFSSSLSFAASEVAERNGVSYWELGAISDPITERGFQYLFRTNPTAATFAKVEVKFINEVVAPKLGVNPGDLKIAIAHEDSLYGSTVAGYIEEYAKEGGLSVGLVQPYNSKAVDLSSVIMGLKKYDPDVVLAISYITDAILFWRQAKEYDFSPKAFIGTGGGHTMKDFQDALGSDVNGIFNVDFTQYAVNRDFTPGMDEFIELYKKTYGEEPRSGHSVANYMGAMVLFDVLEKAGSMDPDAIRKEALAYEKELGTTPTGWGVKFNPETGQNELGEPFVLQWTEDGLVTVWPEGAAVKELTFPMPTWQERAKE
ncbi:ABC transporter substrate-binding protein [Metallumcola ferriviriculae]|uniref:ABC transporter substrate-binding protein n=1 Tax=Metallumcola ferriviriculae TaxID=3039180 RepID=A0AAU0UQG7_9FIRM|nr:ABC transporter substrate-binding protein [Desulfitibacteraceae bacterium MK1]